MADEAVEVTSASDDNTILNQISIRADEVNDLLAKKDRIRALLASLRNPPISTKSEHIKVSPLAVIKKLSITGSKII
jgi:hypothetical protein